MPLRTIYYHRYSQNKGDFIKVVHEKQAIPIIQDIVRYYRPPLMLELGTSWGGVTMILNDANPNAELYTFDLPAQNRVESYICNTIRNIHVCKCDILTNPHKPLIDLCADKRQKLLYCDNGNKLKEVLMYAPYLRTGDILGVHDWGREISFDYEDLDVHHKEKNTREEIEEFTTLIDSNFVAINTKIFVENECSTRMWIKE